MKKKMYDYALLPILLVCKVASSFLKILVGIRVGESTCGITGRQ